MRDPLVLLPGLMCDSRLFRDQIEALSADHAVMVAPVSQGERMEEIASALLDQLPPRFALAGHSVGGMVAMEILRRAPDRVLRLALMNTSPLAETPQAAADYEPAIIKLKSGRLDEAVQALIPAESLAPGSRRQAMVSEQVAMAARVGEGAIIRQIRAMQRRRDYQPVLRRCRVPTLVLCGAEDALIPVKRHGFLAELIPYARLEVIEGAGHLTPMEEPEATTAALRTWIAQPYVLQSRTDA
ncbi:pimeloyl-ACP methyl ester carboxylesterase [Roseovarius halotolerans]|uniref:3-oxoadipate enol-lactonase 2 n=1 Tax=Roseovarius halotolerans TaxID=505353 RepID=A0A1X6ZAM9_9RHOB|nr:alpha/beta fold hydrolase [Roseovarius halotolerans]RKT30525.1 pimeloyl-ACP methyl ester carboxylesterase [Roseovarius halotolerans]SLN45570.1 3-oxoadipate enol-lactonase 2 [Roseovarius halotolerans]